MVNICEDFARVNHLKFSTNEDSKKSKTKCIVFSKKKADQTGVAPILLNEMALPWVNEVKHLGNVLQSENENRLCCQERQDDW